MTLEDRLKQCRGFGPGFDTVRVVLALFIMLWHGFWVTYGPGIRDFNIGPVWMLVYAVLPAFFALSGFLVAASAIRLPLREYIINRGLRIVPALAVDIALSALILGPLFTMFALAAYFTAPDFFAYFLNIVGNIHFTLPGVFLNNPHPNVVNAALWTVPYEIACYVVMSAMIVTGIIRSKLLTAGACVAWLLVSVFVVTFDFKTGVGLLDKIINFVVNVRGTQLVPFFLAGAALYVARSHVPFDARLALASVALMVVITIIGQRDWYEGGPYLDAIMCAPIAYLTVWCGLSNLPKLPIFRRGDYSYGIYLYHFPVLQAIVALTQIRNWVIIDLIGLVSVTMFAMFSWHCIEKPILRQRRRFSVIGSHIAAN